MKFFLASLLIAACLAFAQSSAIYGPSYAAVPVIRHVPVVRHVPVLRHVPVVDSVVVPVHRTAYVASPPLLRVAHVDTPLAYNGWLKQK